MSDLSLDEITKRLVDAILEERHINRSTLPALIRPVLKIWLKKADSFKSNKVGKPKLQQTIEQKELEQRFWRDKVRAIAGNDKMQPYYDELNKLLSSDGY